DGKMTEIGSPRCRRRISKSVVAVAFWGSNPSGNPARYSATIALASASASLTILARSEGPLFVRIFSSFLFPSFASVPLHDQSVATARSRASPAASSSSASAAGARPQNLQRVFELEIKIDRVNHPPHQFRRPVHRQSILRQGVQT